METAELGGTSKAAIFLMALGEEAAATVLQHMGPREVQKIGTAMAAMPGLSRRQVASVLAEFTAAVEDQSAIGVGSDEYVRNVLRSALGEDKANNLIDRILTGRDSKGLEALKWMDPRQVAEIIRLEHPQIIAIVLSYLDADQAAETLGYLPDRVRPDVVMRIATLDGIQPHALQELDQILEKQFAVNTNVKSSSMGGLRSAANILNFMDSNTEGEILESIASSDQGLSQTIQDLMFTFDDLVDLDDTAIQRLLREVSGENLVIALKGAEERVRTKIFRNMSKRASEMLRDDLDSKGPVKLSDVEAAQKEILSVVRRLAEDGEIALGGSSSEQYV